ncbi:class I SAM-dependent methyltransferase [Aurantibacter crassamenti]|uniref:class I SAM-dependent methyltransferase n=1 Tax=Aurantibacter crassamenti TaxID=1837375 RepID=UPI0019398687|nr:class I SAM-dependent methyltransferase [Aurantibacter crassamenti]MBM1105234.1 class I SAM-dependent methyltransferase [Aurantibacter crassamenti]
MSLYLKTKDHSVTGEEFELHHNEELDMLITRPQPKDLDKYYKSDNYISHTDSSRTVTDKIYQIVKRFSLVLKVRLISCFVKDDKSLLDVGAGTGDFLVVAKQKGWAVFGVEPSWRARGKASEKEINLSSELESVMDRKYQVITLWHVLEHLADLENQILKMISLLEENGTIVIAVPNYKSYDAKYYKENWAAYDVPRHLWHFSKEGMRRLFAKYQMEVVETKPLYFDSFYVSLLSEKYKGSRLGFVKGIFRGLCSNVSALFTKEYSSLIYIIKKA